MLLSLIMFFLVFFFFKQKTAYEMRISDWNSDVCSSDLAVALWPFGTDAGAPRAIIAVAHRLRLERPFRAVGARPTAAGAAAGVAQIGRASCRERVCQYV